LENWVFAQEGATFAGASCETIEKHCSRTSWCPFHVSGFEDSDVCWRSKRSDAHHHWWGGRFTITNYWVSSHFHITRHST